MKKENWIEVMKHESTLFCGAMCLGCLFEDDCPLLVKYEPFIVVDSIVEDGVMLVRCVCHTPKKKTNEN